MGGRLFLSGSQTLLLRMPSMATSRMSSFPSQTQSRVNKYMLNICESYGSQSGASSLQTNCTRYFHISSDKQKRRNCAMWIAQWSFLYYSFSWKGEGPPVCSARDKRLTIEHFLFTCSDFIQRRESHFTANHHVYYFKKYHWKIFFNFLKKINIF